LITSLLKRALLNNIFANCIKDCNNAFCTPMVIFHCIVIYSGKYKLVKLFDICSLKLIYRLCLIPYDTNNSFLAGYELYYFRLNRIRILKFIDEKVWEL